MQTFMTRRSSAPQTQFNKIILTPYKKFKNCRKTVMFQRKSEEDISSVLDPIIEDVWKKYMPKYS